jgi:hypothetical protein
MELQTFRLLLVLKLEQLVNAEKTLNYNKKVIEEMETFDMIILCGLLLLITRKL